MNDMISDFNHSVNILDLKHNVENLSYVREKLSKLSIENFFNLSNEELEDLEARLTDTYLDTDKGINVSKESANKNTIDRIRYLKEKSKELESITIDKFKDILKANDVDFNVYYGNLSNEGIIDTIKNTFHSITNGVSNAFTKAVDKTLDIMAAPVLAVKHFIGGIGEMEKTGLCIGSRYILTDEVVDLLDKRFSSGPFWSDDPNIDIDLCNKSLPQEFGFPDNGLGKEKLLLLAERFNKLRKEVGKGKLGKFKIQEHPNSNFVWYIDEHAGKGKILRILVYCANYEKDQTTRIDLRWLRSGDEIKKWNANSYKKALETNMVQLGKEDKNLATRFSNPEEVDALVKALDAIYKYRKDMLDFITDCGMVPLIDPNHGSTANTVNNPNNQQPNTQPQQNNQQQNNQVQQNQQTQQQ